jgi:hypothetical protein
MRTLKQEQKVEMQNVTKSINNKMELQQNQINTQY